MSEGRNAENADNSEETRFFLVPSRRSRQHVSIRAAAAERAAEAAKPAALLGEDLYFCTILQAQKSYFIVFISSKGRSYQDGTIR